MIAHPGGRVLTVPGDDYLMFAHVLAAMLWLGGWAVLGILALRALRRGDLASLARFADTIRFIGPRVLAPATILVINAGTLPTGNLKGEDHRATISLILDHSEPGQGPRLHKHPYDETWVVIDGNLTFQAGDEQLEAVPGAIVVVPPHTPHKFTSHGPGRASLVCIHANRTFEPEWLE